MTDRDHLLWLATAIQHLSYEVDEVSRIMHDVVQGKQTMRKVGPDDPGLVPMKPIEVRRMIIDSIGDSLNALIDFNADDKIA